MKDAEYPGVIYKCTPLRISPGDMTYQNIVFHNRVANLRKIYPYIPERLNRILLHFSKGANRFYETTNQLLEDLGEYRTAVGLNKA